MAATLTGPEGEREVEAAEQGGGQHPGRVVRAHADRERVLAGGDRGQAGHCEQLWRDALALRAPIRMILGLGEFEADQAAGDLEEGFVDVGASLVADAEAPVLVEPADRAFDDPAVFAEP